MSVLDRYRVGTERRLNFLREEVREESWKAAYKEAEGCHFFELALDSTLAVFRFIREIEKSWREAVYRGIEAPSDGKDEWLREGFSLWLSLANEMDKSLRGFELRGYGIESAIEFRQTVESTRLALAVWVPPLPARSPLMREEDISDEEAAELRALLEAPSGSPGKLRIAPRKLPEGDASFLR